MIKLTTLVGPMYVRKDSIVAVTARYRKHPDDAPYTSVWVTGCTGSFNVTEDVETIYNLIKPVGTSI